MTAYLALKNLKPEPDDRGAGRTTRAPPPRSAGPARRGSGCGSATCSTGCCCRARSDAAETLAVGVAGSVPAFVARMNQAAKRLGLSDTRYANPIGLDDPDNYSSAHDLVTLASILLRNRLFARIVNTPSATLHSGDHPADGHHPRHAAQLRPMDQRGEDRPHARRRLRPGRLGHPGFDHPDLGGARHSDEPSRDADTLKLLQYGFSLYHPVQPVHRGEELADSQARLPQRPPLAGRAARPADQRAPVASASPRT